MNSTLKFSFPNVLAAIVFAGIYAYFWFHPDNTINETYKNILLIVTGFVWGSSSSSKKKDETISSALDDKNSPPDNVDTVNVKSEVTNVTPT